MRLAAGHFRMRTSSSALDARVLLAAEAWISRRASHDLSRCLRTGRLHELSAGALLTEAGWTDRHRHVLRLVQPGRYRPRMCSSPWQSPWSLRRGETDCEISRWDPGRCMDAGGRPRTLTMSAGRGATRGRSGNVEGERLLDAKRAFPFRIYGQTRPGRTAAGTTASTAVPGVLLTRKRSQVQTLSRPPARR
jgi:hypothetical protein